MTSHLSTTVFWDVDTQYDFLHSDGRLYVPGSEAIIPTLRRLTQYAHDQGIRIVASADDHVPGDPELSDRPDWKDTFPQHCMRGTPGQRKIRETGLVTLDGVKWAKPAQGANRYKTPTNVASVLQPGDVIYVDPLFGKDGNAIEVSRKKCQPSARRFSPADSQSVNRSPQLHIPQRNRSDSVANSRDQRARSRPDRRRPARASR